MCVPWSILNFLEEVGATFERSSIFLVILLSKFFPEVLVTRMLR